MPSRVRLFRFLVFAAHLGEGRLILQPLVELLRCRPRADERCQRLGLVWGALPPRERAMALEIHARKGNDGFMAVSTAARLWIIGVVWMDTGRVQVARLPRTAVSFVVGISWEGSTKYWA